MFGKVFVLSILGTISVFAGKLETLNTSNFSAQTSKGTVLVDFYAPWCGPCKRMGPVLERVADDLDGKVAIYKVDIEQSPDLAKEYEVQGLPTLVLMEGGQVKKKCVGFRDKAEVKAFISSCRADDQG